MSKRYFICSICCCLALSLFFVVKVSFSTTGYNPLFPQITSHGKAPDIQAVWDGTPRWMGGINWGGETFFGSFSKGFKFFVTATSEVEEADYVPVEIKFNNDTSQQSVCQTFRITGFGTTGYNSAGTGTFPGSAWDMRIPSSPRRLNICFTEWDDGADPLPAPNFNWDPDGSDGPFYGKREYLFVMTSDYDSGAMYAGQNISTDSLDVLYAWWPRVEPGHTFFETDTASLKVNLAFFQTFQATPDSGRVILRWIYSDTGVQKVRIYYSTSSPANILLDSVPGSLPRYEHTGLNNGTTYYYKFEAVDAGDVVLQLSGELSVSPLVRSQKMTLYDTWNGRNNYGGIWGYTDTTTGREYALVCSRSQGLSIVDVTEIPVTEVSFIPLCLGCGDTKEVKTYKHYVIIVNEFGPEEIYDVSDPSNPVFVNSIYPCNGGSHTNYVEGDYLYIDGNHCNGGIEIWNISDPANPVFMGATWSSGYHHDVDIRNDTLYGCLIYGGGVDIIDVSDKTNPTIVANFDYPGSGAHNVELSADGRYAFVGDEIGSSGNWTRVFDVSDPFNVTKVSDIIVNPSNIAHNCYIKDGLLYLAHYIDGVRVWNVTNPLSPFEVAYYDTYLPGGSGYSGCWTVYPYFASGKLVASDMQTGLYVLLLDSSLTACSAIPGDADASGTHTLSDIISTVNYIFNKPGCSPQPLCWLSNLLCRGDWNGSGTVSLGDVIRGVNYIFNKPGGPWTPVPTGNCCQPAP